MSIKEMPLEFRIHLHKELIATSILTCCLSCEFSNANNDGVLVDAKPHPHHPKIVKCNKFNAEPPLAVVVVGCVEWKQGLPF